MPKSDIWGAFKKSSLLGFVALLPGWIDHLYVDPDLHRQGIGSALVKLSQERQDELRLYTFQAQRNGSTPLRTARLRGGGTHGRRSGTRRRCRTSPTAGVGLRAVEPLAESGPPVVTVRAPGQRHRFGYHSGVFNSSDDRRTAASSARLATLSGLRPSSNHHTLAVGEDQ